MLPHTTVVSGLSGSGATARQGVTPSTKLSHESPGEAGAASAGAVSTAIAAPAATTMPAARAARRMGADMGSLRSADPATAAGSAERTTGGGPDQEPHRHTSGTPGGAR